MIGSSARSMTASSFNPLGLQFRLKPWTFYPQLLLDSPGFIEVEGEPSAYVATYRHCTAVMRDYKRFSSVRPDTPSMERVDFFNHQPVMTYSDPPMHTRLRRIVGGVFAPGRVQLMRDATNAIVADLLAKARARDQLEVMNELAHPLATRLLLGHFLGVREEDYPIFLNFKASLGLLNEMQPGDRKPRAYLDAWDAGVEYCVKAIDRARREHSHDVIGLVVAAHDEEGKLSDAEMFAMVFVLFAGGISTLASLTGASLFHLARRPELILRLHEVPGEAQNHFEETMRFDPGVLVALRFPSQDVEFEGRLLPKGMPIYVIHAAAGWDASVFPHPERFDITRENVKDHLNFGHGIHTCIGNTIIRATIPSVIAAMAEHFPNMRLADPDAAVEYEGTPRSRQPVAVPLEL